jgi:hypothetical protein
MMWKFFGIKLFEMQAVHNDMLLLRIDFGFLN